jgi:hypothetical protein
MVFPLRFFKLRLPAEHSRALAARQATSGHQTFREKNPGKTQEKERGAAAAGTPKVTGRTQT